MGEYSVNVQNIDARDLRLYRNKEVPYRYKPCPCVLSAETLKKRRAERLKDKPFWLRWFL